MGTVFDFMVHSKPPEWMVRVDIVLRSASINTLFSYGIADGAGSSRLRMIMAVI